MRKLIILILLVSSFSSYSFAQKKERERTPVGGRPDIKGDLFLDFGFNMLNNRPSELNTIFLQSRTMNIYYHHPVNLFGDNSGLTFNPGIGISSDKLGFTEDQNLFNNPALGPNSSTLLPVTEVYGDNLNIGRNNVRTNYLEIPLEFRYHLNRSDYRKGIRFALGGKVGYLLNAQTKIRYTDSQDLQRQIKDRQSFGFSQFRYGVYTRMGFSGFNIWGYYGLNQVFEKGQGPFATEATQFNFGVSVALF